MSNERARMALWGLAIGDALGMPTQSMAREDINGRFGPIAGFLASPSDQPIAPGRVAGSVTDDTEQAVLLGYSLIEGRGRIDQAAFASALISWEQGMIARGSLDLLGPSTRRAIAELRAGTPAGEAGAAGTTNGAAMRITPVGLAASADDLKALVDVVVQTSELTHNTSPALAAASAVAAAVSVGVAGGAVDEAIEVAIEAADLGSRRGRWVAGGSVSERILWAVSTCAGRGGDALDELYTMLGTGLAANESVPAAFGILAMCPDDPWRACRLAAGIGGDTDTIAAIVGAIGGACLGASAFPASARETVAAVNTLELDSLADGLYALRLVIG
ncbi:ADP-ribosylglycohydrolase family protein [Jatrophihabitans telluris]|uniref:ADP-ribosylglycohydrolase family protein n=1 Tax=Jatrophihabitans telluris TaxID=2038343 RepID=A0ABY4R4C9_9ACTN|nr:ADP-ribosylglycohydrolase family protein [Jatrophihabitans telluris]UQX89784.1 ADP-ribosylglycohydrolase family protein [Jatrophihabitans telluris]